MHKRLAITIAGAVSLGSYEAGVLFEVLDAIQKHNAVQVSEDQKIFVDVLTGASAGGMTAIIAAQKMLYGADEFVGPYDNPFYNAWVKRINLVSLQNTKPDEPALQSLFSSDLIEQISQEFLMQRWAGAAPAPATPHGAAAAELRIGVAMTNLNGVAYGEPVKPSGTFVYIDHADQLTRCIQPASCDNKKFWEPLRQAAVACGAFPVAFRPQDIARSSAEEPQDFPPQNLQAWVTDPATFTYSDGGILQNQPLGMAKNLVDLVDKHLHQETRFYLFVSPNAKDPKIVDNVHAADMNYLVLVKRLVGTVLGQASFQDWIIARDINAKIALLDDRANGLMEAIISKQIGLQALAQTAESLLNLFFKDGVQRSPGATHDESLNDAQTRISMQYCTEMQQLENQAPGSSIAFRDSVLAFETAAGLGARDSMTVYGMTATNTELAGAGLSAFLGFFDQKFRDHDYDVGRAHARKALNDPGSSALGLGGYDGSAIRPIDPQWNGVTWGNVPPADKSGFEAALKNRFHQMLSEGLGPVHAIFARPLVDFAVDELFKHL